MSLNGRVEAGVALSRKSGCRLTVVVQYRVIEKGHSNETLYTVTPIPEARSRFFESLR